MVAAEAKTSTSPGEAGVVVDHVLSGLPSWGNVFDSRPGAPATQPTSMRLTDCKTDEERLSKVELLAQPTVSLGFHCAGSRQSRIEDSPNPRLSTPRAIREDRNVTSDHMSSQVSVSLCCDHVHISRVTMTSRPPEQGTVPNRFVCRLRLRRLQSTRFDREVAAWCSSGRRYECLQKTSR